MKLHQHLATHGPLVCLLQDSPASEMMKTYEHMKTLLNISFKNAEHTRKGKIPFVCMEIPLSRVLLLLASAFAQKRLSRRQDLFQNTHEISGSMGIRIAASPKCFK